MFLNRVMLAGKAYELKQAKTNSDKDTVSFTLMIVEKFGDEAKKTYVWCNAYAGLANNIAKYWEEGKNILVEGRINQYKDKEGKYKFSITANEVKFI